jgi:hypothetical protein
MLSGAFMVMLFGVSMVMLSGVEALHNHPSTSLRVTCEFVFGHAVRSFHGHAERSRSMTSDF